MNVPEIHSGSNAGWLRAEAESWLSSSVGDENPMYPSRQLGHDGRGQGWSSLTGLASSDSAESTGMPRAYCDSRAHRLPISHTRSFHSPEGGLLGGLVGVRLASDAGLPGLQASAHAADEG